MALGDFSNDGQADARSRVLLLSVQALEDPEDPVVVLHVESDALIGHRHHHAVAVPVRANRNAAVPRRAELDGVGDEIGERLLEALPLGHDLADGQVLGHRQATGFHLLGEVLKQLVEQWLQGHRPALDGAALEPGIAEEVVDQLSHAAARASNRREVSPPGLIEAIAIVLLQGLAEPNQAAQGRLEVMGHGIGERLELPVGFLQLPGARLHPLLQLEGLRADLRVKAGLRDGDGELGRDFLRDADQLLRKMSSPPASIGTTMYTRTPDARKASASGPAGNESTSITCGSPRRRASMSPANRSGYRMAGPRRRRRRPTAASHSTSPVARSKRLTMARGTPRRSRSRKSTASAIATGSSFAIRARSISRRISRRSA